MTVRKIGLGIVVGLLCATSLQAVPVDLSLEPSLQTVNVGDTVTLGLWARSTPSESGITGVEALIRYDPALLTLVLDGGGGAMTLGPLWDPGAGDIQRNVDVTDGASRYVSFAGVDMDFEGFSTDFLVGSVTFLVSDSFSETSLVLLRGPLAIGGVGHQSKVAQGITDITGQLLEALLEQTAVVSADANGPYFIDQVSGATVQLDGTDSIGSILTFDWAIEGQPLASGATPTIMWDMLNAMGFGAPGTYALRLTVTGPDNWDEAFTTLTVVPEPLSLSLVGIGLAALAVRRRRRRAWPAP